MAQLSVYKDEDTGEPTVECPGCGERVSPDANPLLDSYDCPECGRAIESDEMKRYGRLHREWQRDQDE
jgi:DNA-directed RNA polymerase subunit RPC12/RpoP